MKTSVNALSILQEKGIPCCGCSACESICPKQAIKMQSDREGFLVPLVNLDKCVGCHLCDKVCPMLHSGEFSAKCIENAFVGQLTDRTSLLKSQSGGAFWALAMATIEDNGIVYGCGYQDHFAATHLRADSIERCENLRGSKYVQSSMGEIFAMVKKDLQEKKRVLFTGTPCQCAGLSRFLMRKYDNLVICDLICHGVTTPRLTESYISDIEREKAAKVVDFKYRFYDGEKTTWGSSFELLTMSTGEKICQPVLSCLYYSQCFVRTSCYVCPFGNKVVSDLTIADAWGIADFAPDVGDTQFGVSEILIHNSDKSKELKLMFERSMNLHPAKFSDLQKYQPCLSRPVKKNMRRNAYMKIFRKRGAIYTYLVLKRNQNRKRKIKSIFFSLTHCRGK